MADGRSKMAHGRRKAALGAPEPEWNAGHRPGQFGFSSSHEPRRCSAFRDRVKAGLKPGIWLIVFSFLAFQFFSFSVSAQNYSIDWHQIAGGGGTSTGGVYAVSGTIGQHDAGGPMTGGNYSLTGGFWSLISVVQTAGLPNLTITHAGNSVIVSWPATGSYTLQQNANLASANGWTASGYLITTVNGINSISVTSPVGSLFFRLKQQ